MNIRLPEPQPIAAAGGKIRSMVSQAGHPSGNIPASQQIAGPRTPEGMCLYYLRRMLSDYPQYVNKLWVWFRDRPEAFQWYDPGECVILPKGGLPKTGVLMRLEIQKERNAKGRCRYELVEVEFSFAELAAMPEVDASQVPQIAL